MTKKETFESQLKKLEQIVAKMDGDELSLEKTIGLYEEGVKLSQQLNKTLNAAQMKIEKLSKAEPDGQMETEPFEGNSVHD